ncbi:hypothetical protein BDZ91DRAFT_724657 [Kalaharituber pfeilii]|nr:hypothetical protein BDZ91DRAFT_724657 [Kalaharituber pfeilii]
MRSFDVSNDRLGLLYGLSSHDQSAFEPNEEANLAHPFRRPRRSPSIEKKSKFLQTPENGEDKSNMNTKIQAECGNDVEVKRGKFRFKKTSSRSHRCEDSEHRSRSHFYEDDERCGQQASSKRRKHHRSEDRKQSRDHKRSRSSRHTTLDSESKGFTKSKNSIDDPAAYDDTYLPNSQSFKFTDPDIAFRESLFDAMADDEGAAFWEGVYGQRVDIYPRSEAGVETGKLERMTDDEYAAYVREKMYEKTHEYILEERLKREKARQEAKERQKREREEWEAAERERLRRGRARKQKKLKEKLEKSWGEYTTAWLRVRDGGDSITATMIPWPVSSGQLQEVNQHTVEEFYLLAPIEHDSTDFLNLLKTERIKWHPDKIQQRWGQLENDILTAVNTIFQMIDALWVKYKESNN